MGVSIVGIGSYVPNKVLTNFDLEKIVNTSDEWIRTRTGIKERHIVQEGETTASLAANAAFQALEMAHVKPEEVDAIIVATTTPDCILPATACFVQDKLKATNAFAFDINAACTGFIYALAIGRRFITTGMTKTVLVIGADVLSQFTDWSDRTTCILFADGAGAVVLKETPEKEIGILDEYLASDGSQAEAVWIPAGGTRMPASIETVSNRLHFIKMRGNEIFKFAVQVMAKSINEILARCSLTIDDVDLVIPHQANSRIIEAAAEKVNIPKEKIIINIDRYGNTSSASIPIALDEALKEGKVKDNSLIILVAFGGGLTWGSCAIRWKKI